MVTTITLAEIREYDQLGKQLIGNNMFVIIQDTDQWRRFNELSIRYTAVLGRLLLAYGYADANHNKFTKLK